MKQDSKKTVNRPLLQEMVRMNTSLSSPQREDEKNIHYDPIQVPPSCDPEIWRFNEPKTVKPVVPEDVEKILDMVSLLSKESLNVFCERLADFIKNHAERENDTEMLKILCGLSGRIEWIFRGGECNKTEVFVNYARNANVWPALLDFRDPAHNVPYKGLLAKYAELQKRYNKPLKEEKQKKRILKNVPINITLQAILGPLVKAWVVLHESVPDDKWAANYLREEYQRESSRKYLMGIVKKSSKEMQSLYKKLITMPPPNLQYADEWNDIVWQRILFITDNKPELHSAFNGIGETAIYHNAYRKPYLSCVKAKMKEIIKTQVRKFLSITPSFFTVAYSNNRGIVSLFWLNSGDYRDNS